MPKGLEPCRLKIGPRMEPRSNQFRPGCDPIPDDSSGVGIGGLRLCKNRGES